MSECSLMRGDPRLASELFVCTDVLAPDSIYLRLFPSTFRATGQWCTGESASNRRHGEQVGLCCLAVTGGTLGHNARHVHCAC
eukprot:6194828-Pleurochrysis_carterae.AAC.1